MAAESHSPRLSPLLDVDCDDVECDLMLDALQHHLEQVEGRLNELLVESEAQAVKEKTKSATTAKENSNKISRQSTLPPVLASHQTHGDIDVGHGMEQSEATVSSGRMRWRRETERLKQEEEKERQKQKRIDQAKRHLALIEQMEYVKEDVREEYYAALCAKISRQRKLIQERDERMERRRAHIKRKQMRKKERQPRSDGVDDWSFLNNIEQTQYYKIVSLETELRRDGMVTSGSKIQELWEAELSGNNRQLVPVKKRVVNEVEKGDGGGVNDVSGGEEEVHSWAITSVPPSMLNRSEHSSSRQTKSSSVRSKRDTNTADDFQKRFPKVTLPPLKSLTMKLKEDSPARDDWLEQRQEIIKERKRAYKKKVHMYRQALFNQLATQQLLTECDLFASQPELDLADILLPIESRSSLDSHSETAATSSPSRAPSSLAPELIIRNATPHNIATYNDSDGVATVESELSLSHGSDATGSSARWDTLGFTSDTSIPSLPKLMERRRQKRQDKDQRRNLESESVSEIPVCEKTIPLTMRSLMESQSVIVECKKPSSLWVNYLKA